MISLDEFETAYDEGTVISLFAYMRNFKIKAIQEMESESLSMAILIRKNDLDCDSFLNYHEFKKWVETMQVQGLQTDQDVKFLFEAIDSMQDQKIDVNELGNFLHGESIVDVIEIT